MRTNLHFFAALGLVTVLVGCQSASEPPAEKPATESAQPGEDAQSGISDDTSSKFTLVRLKVPNMT